MQKLRTGGYDGKGVTPLKNNDDATAAFDAPSVLEKWVSFEKEIAVIVARNKSGQINSFPAVEMEFNPEANLVEFLFAPANISHEIEAKAQSIAVDIITKLDMVGILAVEMFLTKDGEILVNEIAPRPHNSGHQTIEGNITSQYEQHLRAILDMPLGDTSLIAPVVMVNILGEKGYAGPAIYEGLDEVLSIPGAYIHLYGKTETKSFRKMGHCTVLHRDLETAKQNARKVLETLKVIA
jgi:5-(carboxyamino)imidazole ribonucleotide synthase